jgi:DNA-binding transcriptional ArsR family regulator
MTTTKAVPAAATKARSKKDIQQAGMQARRASALLKQVGNATRIRIVLVLADGERHVGGLCGEIDQTQAAVSHHLTLMRNAGIVAPRRNGKQIIYCLTESGEKLAEVVKALVV